MLHGHEKTIAHDCEACIDADSLLEAFNPLPLPTNWFGMALNVADPPHERTHGVDVGRERV